MFNFKALLATAAVAAASFVTIAPAAEARTCFDYAGGVLCNSYLHQNSRGQSVYRLGYSNGYFTEGMDVVCSGRNLVTWRSHGNMDYSLANRLASNFCFL